ncbi:PAS domain-containing protein [Ferrimonas sediminicola]|uniref:histidine kinase n=2 Tax=Ferrimonas sediminicola TaxID=2569538 RepID=A0A4U1BIS0_9GAMM|nr:PAS domain-containing protein [Ferrimonas sediminicola]
MVITRSLPSFGPVPGWLQALLIAGLLFPLLLGLMFSLTRPLRHGLASLEAGVLNFSDADFSATLPLRGSPEIRALASHYNQMAVKLRQERYTLHQRELILDKVIQNSPVLVLLTDPGQRVILANRETERFFGRSRLEGLPLDELLADQGEPVQAMFRSQQDGLFQLSDGQQQSDAYHLVQGQFQLHNRPHRLILLRCLTRELARQEAAAWKKVIRVISHELNNSLAPISSMSHSGLALLTEASDPRLQRVFNTIEERCASLNQFIQGYATFAKLPAPRAKAVDWCPFVEGLRAQYPFLLTGSLPRQPGWFDLNQMERVLVNLLKNAGESGSPETQITLEIKRREGGVAMVVSDRGAGMSDATLNQALLPFYSTKHQGTGLGLALCREITEAHGGQIQLRNRQGGGLRVSLWLPDRGAALTDGANGSRVKIDVD